MCNKVLVTIYDRLYQILNQDHYCPPCLTLAYSLFLSLLVVTVFFWLGAGVILRPRSMYSMTSFCALEDIFEMRSNTNTPCSWESSPVMPSKITFSSVHPMKKTLLFRVRVVCCCCITQFWSRIPPLRHRLFALDTHTAHNIFDRGSVLAAVQYLYPSLMVDLKTVLDELQEDN